MTQRRQSSEANQNYQSQHLLLLQSKWQTFNETCLILTCLILTRATKGNHWKIQKQANLQQWTKKLIKQLEREKRKEKERIYKEMKQKEKKNKAEESKLKKEQEK